MLMCIGVAASLRWIHSTFVFNYSRPVNFLFPIRINVEVASMNLSTCINYSIVLKMRFFCFPWFPCIQWFPLYSIVFYCFLNVHWFAFCLLILLILRGQGVGLGWAGVVHIFQEKNKNRGEPGGRSRRQWANRSLLAGMGLGSQNVGKIELSQSRQKTLMSFSNCGWWKNLFSTRKKMLAGWLAGLAGVGRGVAIVGR